MGPAAWGPVLSLCVTAGSAEVFALLWGHTAGIQWVYLPSGKQIADTVSAATEFHLAEEPVLIHQASLTLPCL